MRQILNSFALQELAHCDHTSDKLIVAPNLVLDQVTDPEVLLVDIVASNSLVSDS